MKLTFDPDFDSGAWPGPLAGRAAVGGEEWVGPEGLLGRLELALGLGGPARSAAERAASIVPRVLRTEGFWSESAQVDPLGSARRLLVWRDELAMGGWKGGEIAAPRLRQLADVTREAPPGRPDRLAAVAAALDRRDVAIRRLDLFCPRGDLDRAWRDVLERLALRGVAIGEIPPEPAIRHESAHDLRAAAAPAFAPRHDGSLQLLRPYGPLAAAETIAAYLAAGGDLGLDDVVIVAPDAVLDGALHRHGLPATGAAGSVRENLRLQILPLVLALAWNPPDPQRALELLTLDGGPVPAGLAARLARALHEWPAVGSDVWHEALAAGLEAIDSDERRARVRSRFEVLFTSSVEHQQLYPATEVRRRLDVLEAWARGRSRNNEEPDAEARWLPTLEQLGGARRLLDAAGFSTLSTAQLQWLVDAATEAVPAPIPYPAQAGLAAVSAPGAIAGPAGTVIWWNFTLDAAPPVHRLPLSPGERAALLAQGVELHDPGREALVRAARWRRPLRMAARRLMLVSPRRAANGDEAFPHPLWDEIVALVPSQLRARLERETPWDLADPPRRAGTHRSPPAPRHDWRAPAGRIAASYESPSSLQSLLGCSLQWTLARAAGLRSGATGPLPADEVLAGKLAHEILERVLEGAPPLPEAARRQAEMLFDELGPRLAAALFQPGAEDPRHEARHNIALSAAALAQALGDSGLAVLAREQGLEALSGPWKGRLRGRADLIAGPPPMVIDLKWGAWQRRRSLELGTALQLAAYAVMMRERPRAPLADTAYFILRTQQLLTTSDRFLHAERVRSRATTADTWAWFEAAYEKVWRDVQAGVLVAPGTPDAQGEIEPDEDDVDLEGRLVLAPNCTYCELGALCGRTFIGGRESL